jgi:hypothetical protein
MAENLYLHLTLDETNLLLEALGQLPYIQVHQLIAKIQEQASEQLQEAKRKTENQNTQQQS